MAPRRKKTKPTPPSAASTDNAMSPVLGDDELLRKILLGLDYPTCLIRAAAVSKRWFRHASDPAFLRRFRDLHPPRLLGFYVRTESGYSPRVRFVQMPQLPPELGSVIRRGGFDLDGDIKALSDCRNGDLIVFIRPHFYLYSPLRPGRGTTAHPPLAVAGTTARQMLPDPDAGGDCTTTVSFVRDDRRGFVLLSDVQPQAGSWGEARATHVIELPPRWRIMSFGLLANGKLYMIGTVSYILGIDLASKNLFQIKLPRGVKFDADSNFNLSRADEATTGAFYLIVANQFQIRVWLHRTGRGGAGNWKLVDTICVWQALGNLGDPHWCLQADAIVYICAVGDNADFVLFQVRHQVFYMNVRSRVVEKVFESQESQFPLDIRPFMMVWPPTFPALNDNTG